MKNCIIIGGADIQDYSRIKSYLGDEDFYIYCDSGLKHLEKLEKAPNLVVGDFDSYQNPNLDIETIVLPRAKDDTDTMFAVKEGIKRGFESFVIIGATGGRIDHTLGNLYMLLYLYDKGKRAILADDFSEISVVDSTPAYVDDCYPYFSIINIEGTAKGITIENAKFPLENAEISTRYQYGMSNEVIRGKRAKITVNEGTILLIKDIK